MSQKQKNITLIVILGMLILSSIVLGLTGESSINTIENKERFAVQDTSKIDAIFIKTKEQNIELKKTEGIWTVNEKYKAEQNIVFPVSQVQGPYHYEPSNLKPLPVTVSGSKAVYTKCILSLPDKDVGILDDSLLFRILARNLT